MGKSHSGNQKTTFDKVEEERSRLRPYEFMRGRHPDLFSDSKVTTAYKLPREVFDHHLETLTNRKQETEFEHFCRRLAEKELCPNLIPQTGPTGGGDSKVDSETYPVADELSIRWYQGVGREAAQERWAFAFSSKKDWRPKVRSDVEKIVSTGRNYKLIYFITNQFVRDKTRAEVEDTLTQEFNVDVRILDRSWIIKCVFEHDRLHLAAETLGIQGYYGTTIKQVGPQDTKRQSELNELEELINDSKRYEGVEYQLAEDCLQAALLARGMELPRPEVEGRFQRAKSISERVGHRQQMLRIVYNMSWTAYWWYEDFEQFNNLYDQAEGLAAGSLYATDIELIANLWQILHTAIKRGVISVNNGRLKKRTKMLKAELDRLAGNTQRPNNATHARINRLLVELSEALLEGRKVDHILAEFKRILQRSQGLIELPVITITQLVQELGEVLPDNPQYEELLETVIEITERRASEGEAGKVLLKRAHQKLLAGKSYDAIKLSGRAQLNLAMEETKAEWIIAVAKCGIGYERVGLLWAARSSMLMATNHSFSEYLRLGTLLPQTLACVNRLIWLELQLGRVPHVLAWIELAAMLANQLLLDIETREKFIRERTVQDQVLGILLLNTDIWYLKWLDFLPQALEQLGLFNSWMALLYALGYEDYLRTNEVIPTNETPGMVQNFFIRWSTQLASNDLPEHPDLLMGQKVILRSHVLGCEVMIEASNNYTSVYLSEMILGALEAFLATSLESETVPYRSELHIRVNPSDYLSGLPVYQDDESTNVQTINVRHPRALRRTTQDERSALHSWLQDFIIHVTTQVAVIFDFDSFADRLLKSEQGIGRALILADIDVAVENIFGQLPKLSLSDWKVGNETPTFPLRRTLPWDYDFREEIRDVKQEPLQFEEEEVSESVFEFDKLKHKDRKVISLIDIPLWNKAKWRAIGYICVPEYIPVLALAFEDIETAKLIFKAWKNRVGRIDEQNQLRVSVVTGIDARKPASYRVAISTNPGAIQQSGTRHFVLVSRVHTMEPPNSDNLNNFLKEYEQAGRYTFLPAHFKSRMEFPEPMWDYQIGKSELIVRSAWQIGEHDPDIVAIMKGDKPVIPADVKNAPVIRALHRHSPQRKQRKR